MKDIVTWVLIDYVPGSLLSLRLGWDDSRDDLGWDDSRGEVGWGRYGCGRLEAVWMGLGWDNGRDGFGWMTKELKLNLVTIFKENIYD